MGTTSRYAAAAQSSRRIESLEGRRLLSSVLSGGTLTLTGTSGNDAFVLTKSGTNVSVIENGAPAKLFALSSVTRINASLNGGNDTINIGNSLTIPASVSGGDGDDGLITGGGNDTVDGGIGNDYIEGRDGSDTVTYESRTTPVAAFLDPSYAYSTNSLAVTGGGGAWQSGAATESDSYYSVEIIQGGSADDRLSIRGGDDVFNDTGAPFPKPVPLFVYGNGGNDRIVASGVSALAPALADGGAGNDTLLASSSAGGFTHSNASDTTLAGGEGDDEFDLTSNDDRATVIPGAGFDTVSFDQVAGSGFTMPSGLETLYAYHSPGPIFGNDEDNTIFAYTDQPVDARGGDDWIITGSSANSAVTISGGDGNDELSIDSLSAVPTFDPGAGYDEVFCHLASGGQFMMPAGLEAFNTNYLGNATVHGSDGDNEIVVQNLGGGLIDARGGDDRIRIGFQGGTGGTVLGGEGNDSIDGFAANLLVDAGAGDDSISLGQNVGYGSPDEVHQTVVSGSGSDSLFGDDYDLYSGSSNIHLAGPESVDFLYIGEGSRVIVDQGATRDANTLYVKHLYVAKPDHNDPAGTLELNDNTLIASIVGQGDETTPGRGGIDRLLADGRIPSQYGRYGVRSRFVESTPGTVLGVAEAQELFTTFPVSFAGHTLVPTDVIVRSTRAGDVNLDRKVDFADLVILSQNYGQSGRTYATGNIDFSDDGAVDFSDLVILAQGYGSSLLTSSPSMTAGSTASSVVDVAGSKKRQSSARTTS